MGIRKETTEEDRKGNNGNQEGNNGRGIAREYWAPTKNNGRGSQGNNGTSKRTTEEDRKGIMGISKEE